MTGLGLFFKAKPLNCDPRNTGVFSVKIKPVRLDFMNIPNLERDKTIGILAIVIILFLMTPPSLAISNQETRYIAVPGLIDLRSTFSDGAHTIEELVQIARSREFRVLFINDHDRIELSYGLPPFRKIMRYKKEYPSIMTHGSKKFIDEIDRVSKKYPDVLLIPGSTTSPFYYWSGSLLKGNLTAHQYDRRILILNFDENEDYGLIPNVGNNLSLRYTKKLLPRLVIFMVPLFIGFGLLVWRKLSRLPGLLLIIFSILAIIDYNPFRSSLFNPYAGDQGIAPFQELIDYVNQRGGFSFWNYPEQRSGVRKHGPIHVSTPPYPQVLYQSKNYTGFAAIYGDNITITDPGKEWDRVLNEYCRGKREKAPWGISTADFHEDGRLGLKLGFFPTTFLIREFSKKAILDALEKGRMYCSRGDGHVWPRLDYFNVFGNDAEKAFMGETLTTSRFPVIKFRVSYNTKKPIPISIRLIRGGTLIHTFNSETPMEVEYMDEKAPPGEKTYYRLVDNKKHLTSNPIFVRYDPAPPD